MVSAALLPRLPKPGADDVSIRVSFRTLGPPRKGRLAFRDAATGTAANTRTASSGAARPWSSLSVEATVWRASLFANSKSGCYLLQVRTSVRSREALSDGDTVDIAVKLPS